MNINLKTMLSKLPKSAKGVIIIIGIILVFNRMCGKKLAKIICIIIIIFYITLTGYSPSIIRAFFSAIIILIGGL